MAGFECGFAYRIAGLMVVTGKFDNQDAVLRREGDQQDDTDLCIDANWHAHDETTQNGP